MPGSAAAGRPRTGRSGDSSRHSAISRVDPSWARASPLPDIKDQLCLLWSQPCGVDLAKSSSGPAPTLRSCTGPPEARASVRTSQRWLMEPVAGHSTTPHLAREGSSPRRPGPGRGGSPAPLRGATPPCFPPRTVGGTLTSRPGAGEPGVPLRDAGTGARVTEDSIEPSEGKGAPEKSRVFLVIPPTSEVVHHQGRSDCGVPRSRFSTKGGFDEELSTGAAFSPALLHRVRPAGGPGGAGRSRA